MYIRIQITKIVLVCMIVLVPLYARQYTVISTADSVNGSLRYAIDSALSQDTILFNFVGRDTLYLKDQINLTKDIYIDGTHLLTGKKVVVKPGGLSRRVFFISGAIVRIKKMVISGGYSASGGGNIYVQGAKAHLILDSTIVENGRCSQNSVSLSGGGAIFNDSGMASISNCTFTHNYSYNCPGGCIYTRYGELTIKNSSILQDSTTRSYGGGLYIHSGKVSLLESIVAHNTAMESGGGIYVDSGSLTIVSSQILSNRSGSAGGGLFNRNGNITIDKSIISQDTGTEYGGGIYNECGTIIMSQSKIDNNRARNISLNRAQGGNYMIFVSIECYGGGVFNKSGYISSDNCTLSNNSAFAHTSSGSSLCHVADTASGGGAYNQKGSLIFKNSVISGNFSYALSEQIYSLSADLSFAAAFGGGIFNTLGWCMVDKCEMANNYCLNSKRAILATGGAIYNCQGKTFICNSTCANDSTTYSMIKNAVFNKNGCMTVVQSTFANLKTKNIDYNAAFTSTDSSCYLINTVLAGNWLSDFNGKVSKEDRRIVHSVFNLDTNTSAKLVFNTTTPRMANNGGATRTISLGASSSIAYRTGVRLATFAKDTILDSMTDRIDTLLYAAYWNDTNWIAIETNSKVPSALMLTEITTDQRGVTRNNPPCIGAFEFTQADTVSCKLGKNNVKSTIGYRIVKKKLYVVNIAKQDIVLGYSVNGKCLMRSMGNMPVNLENIASQPILLLVKRKNENLLKSLIFIP